jgi:hypothetical protein
VQYDQKYIDNIKKQYIIKIGGNKMLKNIKWNIFIVNIIIDVLIIIILNIFSEMKIDKGLMFSLTFFTFGIICSLFLALMFYIIYQFNEIMFQFFTVIFILSSFIGLITVYVNLHKEDAIVLSIIIPLINILFLCLHIKLYIWKIDRDKYLENKRRKRDKINKEKIKI